MILTIERLDHHGRGIAHYEGKVVFIENALPNEKVKVEFIKVTNKYIEAKILDYIEKSSNRVTSKCPLYGVCGGCHIRHMSYEDTLSFKRQKVSEILKKYAGIEADVKIIGSPQENYYRNKIEIKIKDGLVGFYKKGTHDIVEMDRCLNAIEPINALLLNMDLLGLTNAEVIIKSNYNGELLIVITTDDKPNIDIETLREKHKIVGIILNDKTIFGSDNFMELIDSHFFKETYNSFFQVNSYVNKILFDIIKDNIKKEDIVLDLCCGVGTLSIIASEKASEVYGLEIVENAIKDALINTRMNKRDNIKYVLGDAFTKIEHVKKKISTIIIDPPRSGVSPSGIKNILNINPRKIIYISCDPVTLARDVNLLKGNYNVASVTALDMFPYTYHVESVVILEKIK